MSATASTIESDFQPELPAGMETFTIEWLSGHFKTSRHHWLNLIDAGALYATNLKTPAATKSMFRIPRASLIKYLKSKTI